MTITRIEPVMLDYSEAGDGPPLLLIMGLNAPGRAWEPHTRAWQHRFRCVSVDNRGAGASPAPPGPYTTVVMAEDYAQLIRTLDLGPVRVAGISMGGAIAQELALRHPELVERLVLVATWARSDPYTQTILDVIVDVRQHCDPTIFNAHLQSLVWTPDYLSVHAEELQAQRLDQPLVGLLALAAQAAACRAHDTSGRLGQLRTPTLVTAGTADRFIPLASSRAVADAIPGSEWVTFDGSGHVHHWEQIDRFNRLVEEFLA